MKGGQTMRCFIAYKFRIYPNDRQREIIDSTLLGCRNLYNDTLRLCNHLEKQGKGYPGLAKLSLLPASLAKDPDRAYLKCIEMPTLQQAIRELDFNYKMYLRGKQNKPHYKSWKDTNQSYRIRAYYNSVQIFNEKQVLLPQLGVVKARVSRPVAGNIIYVIVKRTKSNKYFISIQCSLIGGLPQLPATCNAVGIDLGIEHLITTSNGDFYDFPESLAYYEEKLKRAKRSLSRKKYMSKNWEKQRIVVARIEEKMANIRKDTINKITTDLVRNNQMIAMETLATSKMMQDKNFSKNLSTACFREIRNQLEYKCNYYGRTLYRVDRYFPSSMICSNCGAIKDMPVGQRTYVCPCCHMTMNRDVNAARNILNKACGF